MKNLTTITGISAVIVTLDRIGILFVLGSFIAITILNSLINKIEFKKDIENNPLQRKRNYISRVFYLIDFAKEIRLSRVKEALHHEFEKTNNQVRGITKKYSKKLILIKLINDYVFSDLLLNIVYQMLLAYKVIVLHSISYGTFGGLSNGVWVLRSRLRMFTNDMLNFQKHSLYITKFRAFLNYENKISDGVSPAEVPEAPQLLELKHVNFTYDGVELATLKDINLVIQPRQKIAIVGYNGAGKSTLLKLIMRLYDPTEGIINYAGDNIKKYKVKDYRNCFGTVFQDYKLFAATLGENVMMDRIKSEYEKTALNALIESGFSNKLETLDNMLETNITKEFYENGIELSGGEAQKVAISRVFAKKCSIVLLDEPSSALDPISEYSLNQSMMKAAEDKTVIFISHRLSTTRIADRIYMMEKGEIIESGSHDELMKLNGKYAEMFSKQAENYQKG